ncbi:MAG: ATP-binding protein [Elusimicrobiota bacterium]
MSAHERHASDGFSVETHPIEGAALLQEAVESVELEAVRLDVRLHWHSPVGDSLLVNADPRRVLQVLANLLNNALRFTPEGGTIKCTAQREGKFVRFSVIDTGPGIPAEKLPRLFDPLHQTNADTHKGSGRSLAVCKGLVAAHGGRIWVESLPEVGAAFNFTLPAVLTPP